MKNLEIKEVENVFNEIIRTCQNDLNFKAELIRNPEKIIFKKYGLQLNPNHKCVVEDQTDESVVYLNIPKPLDMEELELTDEELETVSGGTDFWLGALVTGLLYDGYKSFSRGLADGYNGVDNF